MGVSCLATFAVLLLALFNVNDLRGYLHFMFGHPVAYAGGGHSFNLIQSMLRLLTFSPSALLVVFGLLALSPRRWRLFAAIALIVAIVQCNLPGRNIFHYWTGTFSYGALLIGLGLVRSSSRSGLEWIYVGIVIAVMLPQAIWFVWQISQSPSECVFDQIAADVDRLAPPDATLTVFGRDPNSIPSGSSSHRVCRPTTLLGSPGN